MQASRKKGMAYERMGEVDKAINAYRSFLKYYPEDIKDEIAEVEEKVNALEML